MGEREGKDFGGEKAPRRALLVGVLLFLLLVWGGLGWAVYKLVGL